MAKVMSVEGFRETAKRGTVFCFGPKWSFGAPLIYLEPVNCSGPSWGFWASDPCWPDSDEAFDVLEKCLQSGESFDIETSSTKHMNYVDDLDTAVFMVFEEKDARRLVSEWWPVSNLVSIPNG